MSMSRNDLIKRVSAVSAVPNKDVEKTLDALVKVLTDTVGSKGSGLEKGMKLMGIYQSFMKS